MAKKPMFEGSAKDMAQDKKGQAAMDKGDKGKAKGLPAGFKPFGKKK